MCEKEWPPPKSKWKRLIDEALASQARALPRREQLLFTNRLNDILGLELRPQQDLRGENDFDAFEITVASTTSWRPLLVDGRERGKLTFTVVGNRELEAFFDGLARIGKDLRQHREAIRADLKQKGGRASLRDRPQ
jgi:hypothetical protein